jgi:hypothetical protein
VLLGNRALYLKLVRPKESKQSNEQNNDKQRLYGDEKNARLRCEYHLQIAFPKRPPSFH